MSKKQRRLMLVAGAVAVAAVGVGVTYALWSGEGEGEGRAGATTAVVATINPADGEPDLYPGFAGGDLYFTISNDNPYPITFTDMTVGAITPVPPTTCAAANITVTSPVTGLSLVAPPGTSDVLTITDVVTMLPTATDECQGAAFDVELTLDGEQS